MELIRCAWQGAAAWLQRADKAIKAIVSSKHCLLTRRPEHHLSSDSSLSSGATENSFLCLLLTTAGRLSTALSRGLIPAFCSLPVQQQHLSLELCPEKQLLYLHHAQGSREGCEQGPPPHPSVPQKCRMDTFGK